MAKLDTKLLRDRIAVEKDPEIKQFLLVQKDKVVADLKRNPIEWVHAVDRLAVDEKYDIVYFNDDEIVVKNTKVLSVVKEEAIRVDELDAFLDVFLESKGPAWHKAKEGEESGELVRASKEHGLNVAHVASAFRKARMRSLDDKTWSKLHNTDSHDTDTVHKAAKAARSYGRDWKRIKTGFDKGHKMPAPIILKKADGSHHLVAGNTRLMMAKATGHRPKVHVIDMSKHEAIPVDKMDAFLEGILATLGRAALGAAKGAFRSWATGAPLHHTAVAAAKGAIHSVATSSKKKPKKESEDDEPRVRAKRSEKKLRASTGSYWANWPGKSWKDQRRGRKAWDRPNRAESLFNPDRLAMLYALSESLPTKHNDDTFTAATKALRSPKAELPKGTLSASVAKRIAKEAGISLASFDIKEFTRGLEVEHEHAATVGYSWKKVAMIVHDHLKEDPHYYARLQKCFPEK